MFWFFEEQDWIKQGCRAERFALHGSGRDLVQLVQLLEEHDLGQTRLETFSDTMLIYIYIPSTSNGCPVWRPISRVVYWTPIG